MRINGGSVSGEIIMLGAVVLIAIFGIFKYITAEDNDYARLVVQIKDLNAMVKDTNNKLEDFNQWNEDQGKEIEALRLTVLEYTKKAGEVEKDIDDAQDHLARIRDSQNDLKDRSYPRRVELQLSAPSGAIPIQIYTPPAKKREVTRKTVVKTKTGYRTRSETRQSPLVGDPTAPPQRKKTMAKPVKKVAKKVKVVSKKTAKKKVVKKAAKKSGSKSRTVKGY